MIGKSRYYAPNVNIENDIDGAFFKWPTMSTTDGKPYSIIRKWELDEIPGANLPFKDFSEKDYIIAIYH